jgi:hypothetical protein
VVVGFDVFGQDLHLSHTRDKLRLLLTVSVPGRTDAGTIIPQEIAASNGARSSLAEKISESIYHSHCDVW